MLNGCGVLGLLLRAPTAWFVLAVQYLGDETKANDFRQLGIFPQEADQWAVVVALGLDLDVEPFKLLLRIALAHAALFMSVGIETSSGGSAPICPAVNIFRGGPRDRFTHRIELQPCVD